MRTSCHQDHSRPAHPLRAGHVIRWHVVLGGVDEVRRSVQRAREVACAWCDTAIVVAGRGRLPTYCSSGCRHRAWEQRRAAASGLAAVRVIERPVEVGVERSVERVTEVPVRPRGREWADQLRELARQLDAGRLYDRDLDVVIEALEAVNDAVARRTRHRRR